MTYEDEWEPENRMEDAEVDLSASHHTSAPEAKPLPDSKPEVKTKKTSYKERRARALEEGPFFW